MVRISLLMLLSFNALAFTCPKDPSKWVIFLDSCTTIEADRVHKVYNPACMTDKVWRYHAQKVIKTYKKFGGKKKVWLFTYNTKDYIDYVRPIYAALKCGIKTINFSGYGDGSIDIEKELISDFIASGGIYVASSGNDGRNIDVMPTYPASYDGVIAVGSKDCGIGGTPNYGKKVNKDYCGLSYDGKDIGTSFSAPKYTANLEKK